MCREYAHANDAFTDKIMFDTGMFFFFLSLAIEYIFTGLVAAVRCCEQAGLVLIFDKN